MNKFRNVLISLLLIFPMYDALAKGLGPFSNANSYERIGDEVTVSLGNGIKIQAKISEKFDHEIIYGNLEIDFGSNRFAADSMVEVELGKSTPVKYRILKNGAIEILIVLNDRPSINKYKRFIIHEAQIITDDTIPILKESKLNSGLFIGTMSNSEAVCLKCDSVVYNPILVYQAKISGLSLDSNETKRMNQKLYGKFFGFNYREDIIVVKQKMIK